MKAGDRLGPYEIVAPLGAGGMGVVYRARDHRLGRDVAIKLLPQISEGDADARARLVHEARTAAALNHPHICTMHDVGEFDGVPYLAMELVEGETLQQVIQRGRFSPERVCRIGKQLADALEFAHAHGVVHRDFKSANVNVLPDGRVKVLDFGIAARASAASEDTRTVTFSEAPHRLVGTVGYMAPEVLQGNAVTERSDIWALGVVLYEMTAGRSPFNRPTDSDLIAAILRDAPPPLPSGTPAGLARIIERCLAKEPSQRPVHASEIGLALEIADRDVAGHVAEPRDPAKSTRRSSMTLVAMLTVMVLIAIGGAIFVTSRPHSPSAATTLRFGNPTHVTTAVGVEEFPAWSPDGRTLAYSADPSGIIFSTTWDIWVAQPGGGSAINRTADYAGRDIAPSWSPDGSQIAFLSARDGGGCYVMPALNGVPRRIASAVVDDPNPPQWSPDGTQLGCVTAQPGARGEPTDKLSLTIFSAQTGSVLRAIELPGESGKSFTTWTRDMRKLALVTAYSGTQSDISRLWVVDMATQKAVQLTDGTTKVMSPNWSADGHTLYYVASSGATMDLWAQAIDDAITAVGPPRAMTAGIGMRNAAFSADGRKLAYSQGRKVANVWRAPMLADRAATWADAVQVTSDQAFIECVDLSNDGTRLVVSSDRSGSIDLWTLPASGGEMHQLTTDPSPEWCPSWSPDGSTIAFYAYRTGDREVWTMPVAGGEWRQVTRNVGVDTHPSWSPDGKELLFFTQRGDWVGLFVQPLDGGEGRRLTLNVWNAWSAVRWAPTDRRIAYRQQDSGGVWIADEDGQSPVQVVASGADVGRITWTHDGTGVLYRGIEKTLLYRADANGKRPPRPVLNLSGRRGLLGSYGTPTDGKFIYFTWDEDLGDIWTMTVEGQ